MSGHNDPKGEQAGARHPNYKQIYFVLLGLLVVSVLGPEFGIGWVTLITAFGIALVKANLVLQNFMHLRWEKRIMKWMLSTSVVLMFLLFAGVAPDVMKHEGSGWINDAALAATARGIGAPHHDVEAAATAEHAVGGVEGEAAVAEAPVEQAFDAKGAYGTVCTTCHGPSGAGDGPGAAALNPKPANFADAAFWASRTDAHLVKVIREGGASVGKSALMPAWGGLYNEAQAKALVAYIKTFKK
ncbi:MAG TPA: c-type cytochrome [Longimicrobiales bacterium]|nr:c-type cytochrome [Longimicrobiales bacterium]